MQLLDAIAELKNALNKAELRLSLAEAADAILQELEGSPSREQHEETKLLLETAEDRLMNLRAHAQKLEHDLGQERHVRVTREQQLGAIQVILRAQ